ncbi:MULTISPECIES: fimbrial protein [unclassified Serratia (in: enterobacteria)]|uniref:fimbrial protein n=1 Tax=unclassified Serratia (in: enterobacteria) TaxID=2647522 RepID=UPI0018AB188F|nr:MULTISPECIES: fimbrial protein [unclassified Serratia (in: enterobacteria)]
MKQLTALWPVLALTTALGSALPAQAVDVKFTGTLVVPPPCVINSNSDISVDFDTDMLAGRINGVNYEKPITYTLDCSGATSVTLKLQFQGGGAGFDASVLGTSKANLGLELRSDGTKLPMNTWLNFTNPARPALTAVPVKATSSTLSGGTFTAVTTLLVDYQ